MFVADTSKRPDLIPAEGRQPISEAQTERVLAPIITPGFPAIIERLTEQPSKSAQDIVQAQPSYKKRDSSSSSPMVSSESETEVRKEGSPQSSSEDGRRQAPGQSLADRLASDSRFKRVLPASVPLRVPIEKADHRPPLQSPQVPPQRHNTPHSPLGSRDGSPRESALFGTFAGLFGLLQCVAWLQEHSPKHESLIKLVAETGCCELQCGSVNIFDAKCCAVKYSTVGLTPCTTQSRMLMEVGVDISLYLEINRCLSSDLNINELEIALLEHYLVISAT